MSVRLFAVLILLAGLAFAQLDTNSVTVTASRNVSSIPDQIIFGVFVNSGFNTSLSDIVNAVSSAGITQSNFSTLTQLSNPNAVLQWGFGLVLPFAQLKNTASALASLAQSITQNNSGLTLSFSVVGTQTSQLPPCPIAGLISDAGTQAQNLATGAGRTLGGILALSTATSNGASSTGIGGIYSYSSLGGTTSSSCSLTVKYALAN
jgi:hypothetical protein